MYKLFPVNNLVYKLHQDYVLKSIVNKKEATKIQDKFKLSDDTLATDKLMISAKFNDFFIGIGPSLARKIKPQSVSPLSYLGQSSLHSIYLNEVTLEEMSKILHSLKKMVQQDMMVSLHFC